MSKSFITIFESFNESHKRKDVGTIPYILSVNYDYKSYVFTTNDICLGDEFNENVEIIKIKRLNSIKNIYSLICSVLEISKKSELVVINTYHHRLKYLIINIMAKVLSKSKSYSYVKLDLDSKQTCKIFSRNKFLSSYFRKLLFSKIDLISLESNEAFDIIKPQVNSKTNLKRIPNGINVDDFNSGFYLNKGKVISSAGRLDSAVKNTKLLVDSFVKSKVWKRGWVLKLAGNYDRQLEEYISNEIVKYNLTSDHILLLGPLCQNDLFYTLKESKVYCSTSVSEGFSLGMLEAAASGCLLVSTDVSGISDITCNGELGIITEHNLDSFTKGLIEATEKVEHDDTSLIAQRQFCIDNFDWLKICKSINGYIDEKI
ncbi:glycosyltransferase family 4 protein [Vibrio cyclitrophicus]